MDRLTAMGTEHDDRTLDRAGKYRLGPLLGVGGMAEVFAGHVTGAEGFSRRVAIKRVLASYSANPTFARMFVTEARLASMLASPHVVAVLDFDRDAEGRLYQVMEYVDGVDLEKLAPPGRGAVLPPAIIAYVLGAVLMGLRHAHTATNPATGAQLGIVHRDCTPSNVLIGWDGAVKLSDFGVAKAKQATFATLGSVKGKPMYMAPEQLEAAPDMDARVDLFAVGVMLWELLTGRRPFAPDGEATGVSAVLASIALYGRGDVRIDTAHAVSGGAAPVALSNLAARLMAPRPAQRPDSAHDALAELRSCGPLATADDLAVLLAQRFADRAPLPAAALATRPAAHSVPTNVLAARAGPAPTVQTVSGPPRQPAPTVETIGATPRAMDARPGGRDGDAVTVPRRRRTARAMVAILAATAAGGGVAAVVHGARDRTEAAPGADEASAGEGGGIDAGELDAGIDARAVDAGIDARAVDAGIDAVEIDARVIDAGVARRAPDRARPRSQPHDAGAERRPLIETTLERRPP